MTNEELIDLIESEGSLEYLLVSYGLDPVEIEDDFLRELVEEVAPLLAEIHDRLEQVRVQMEMRERDED